MGVYPNFLGTVYMPQIPKIIILDEDGNLVKEKQMQGLMKKPNLTI